MKRVIVCMKPVPDPKAWDRLKMDPVSKTLIREGIPSVVNPLDKHAVEAALEIEIRIEDEFGFLIDVHDRRRVGDGDEADGLLARGVEMLVRAI